MKTGVIGLGVMGGAMALNLHKHGFLHRVWNRTESRADEVSDATGIPRAETIMELAGTCDVIITCVSRDEDVLTVIGKLVGHITPGTVVIDTSTVSSDTAKQAAGMVGKHQCYFLDCPVTGGAEGARKGTLSLMVGGDEAVLNKVKPVLAAIGSRITYIGSTGSGQACKAVNQVICAGINQAVTEGLSFGEALGLDMERVLEAIAGGAAGNWFMEHRGHTMLKGEFAPGFKMKLHHKDLKICLEMAEAIKGADLQLTAMTVRDYEELLNQGHGEEDISTLFRLKKT